MEHLLEDGQIDALVRELKKRVGTETAPTVIDIDRSMIRKFVSATGYANPVYSDADYAASTHFGGIVAPPTFVSALMAGHWPDIVVRNLPFARELHSADEVSLHRPIKAGDTLVAYAHYVDVYRKASPRGTRLYQVTDFILENPSKERVAHVGILSVAF